jgi:hypothetical protein
VDDEVTATCTMRRESNWVMTKVKSGRKKRSVTWRKSQAQMSVVWSHRSRLAHVPLHGPLRNL